MNENIKKFYKNLVVNRIDYDEFFLLHYEIQASEGFQVIDAAVHTLLTITQRTIKNIEAEKNIDIHKYGAVVTNRQLSNIREGDVTLAIPPKYINLDDPINSLYLLATSVAEYDYCKNIWLKDIEIPKFVLSKLKGPNYGVPGIRRALGIADRPIIGAVIHSSLSGSNKKDLSNYVEECIKGGIDLFVDDLIDSSNKYDFSLQEKTEIISCILKKHNKKNTKNIGYFVYLNHFGDTAKKLIKVIENTKCMGIVVNSFLMSHGYIHNELMNNFISHTPILFCTNMGSSMLGRNPMDEANFDSDIKVYRTGVSEVVTAKLSRFSGADAVHTGTAGAECWNPAEFNMTPHTLTDKVASIEKSMSIAEGDLKLSVIGKNIRFLGKDVIFEISSGISQHPQGIQFGCKSYIKMAENLDPSFSDEEIEAVTVLLCKQFSYIQELLDKENWRPKLINFDPLSAKKSLPLNYSIK